MKTIRPYKLFSRLRADQREIHDTIPIGPASETLSITSLETRILIALARIHSVSTVLEIGTSFGYTALHLAMNLPDAEIETVDIKPRKPCAFADTIYESHITQIVNDSADLPIGQTDMIFIDGDHRYKAVVRDSKFAFLSNPKVIVWHDYLNSAYPDVTAVLDGEFNDDLVHIADSTIAFWEPK